MKFNFQYINNPKLDPENRNKVVGTLRGGNEVVTVERRLDNWNVNLKITVSGHVWHDCPVTKDEIHQVNILRESALANESKQADVRRTAAFEVAQILSAEPEA